MELETRSLSVEVADTEHLVGHSERKKQSGGRYFVLQSHDLRKGQTYIESPETPPGDEPDFQDDDEDDELKGRPKSQSRVSIKTE